MPFICVVVVDYIHTGLNQEQFLMPNTLVILSAPSGVGKTTVTKRFLQKHFGWKQVITCTTRPPRKGELDGIDYRFLNESSFEKLVISDKFLEYSVVYGEFYGTLMSDIKSIWESGHDAILVIDTHGKETVKAKIPHAITVFLLPPSNDEIERRLRSRNSDKDDVIQIRLHRTLDEIKDAYTYDHRLVNNNVEDTVQDLYDIIKDRTVSGISTK